MTLHWYYLYSPRYELFHNLLASVVSECPGITLHAQFVPQYVFSKQLESTDVSGHFFAGQAIKMEMMLHALQQHPGEHIVVSDADILLFDTNFTSYLEQYKAYDMTCMLDNEETKAYNIGLCLLKSTPEMIAFVEEIIRRIKVNRAHDQTEWNALLPSFEGTHAQFSCPDCIQSNMYKEELRDSYRVIQCLCECNLSSDDALVSKLITVAYFYKDLEEAKEMIPVAVRNKLILCLQEQIPDHPVAQWDIV